MTRWIRAALAALGIERFVLAIHDASFPSAPGEDVGRGSPYAEGGRAFFAFASELGFDGVQLGPQGMTGLGNASPYDATLFSRSPLSIALGPLAEPRGRSPLAGLLTPEELEAIVAARPRTGDRVAYAYAFAAQERALAAAYRRFAIARNGEFAELARDLAAFRASEGAWLARDALFAVLARLHGTEAWRTWPDARDVALCDARGADRAMRDARRAELEAAHAREIEAYAFVQWLVHAQHRALRGELSGRGMRLFGDLQIGMAPADTWAHAPLFLRDYRMGAPPSRTTREGQPWGFPVLDPAQYEHGARAFVRARVEKMLTEFDGLRIDHPHGLVCPWVYAAASEDPHRAVREGARLFESPDLPDHPALAPYAIARPSQIDRACPRYADGWVRALDDAQVDAYAVLFGEVMGAAARHGRAPKDVLCEVLSTSPYPLCRVMERWGLGRFRVTQKAKLDDPNDGYRGENADPADWIMLGNHDTDPIARVVARWDAEGSLGARAAYLATRLAPATAASIAASRADVVEAMVADLFVGPARHVTMFFADLYGMHEVYNEPGTVNDRNWTLRVPSDFRGVYAERVRAREAPSLPRALAMALRARGIPTPPAPLPEEGGN